MEAGYWPLYRYNPLNEENPLTIDSKEPTASYQEFIARGALSDAAQAVPGRCEELFVEAEKEAAKRMDVYKKLAAK